MGRSANQLREGREERRFRMLRAEVESLRFDRITLLRQLEFVVDQGNREALQAASLAEELARVRSALAHQHDDDVTDVSPSPCEAA